MHTKYGSDIINSKWRYRYFELAISPIQISDIAESY